MAETSFEALPQDLKMKILSRMSLNYLGRCICASKKLANIIRTKDFIKEYLLRSMTRPRMLFTDRDINYYNSEEGDHLFFYSVYQEEEPLLLSGQQESHIFLDDQKYNISQPIRGLICIREETKIVICNPTTQNVRTLLEMKTPKEKIIADYLLYDEAKDALKVLCVMQMESDKEYKVLTVGSVDEPWRKITCEHDHTPVTEGVCKGGVLYYGARFTNDKSLVMMCFNVSSEEFTVTKLPEEVKINSSWKFVNYNGEIALVNDDDPDLHENGVLQIWVGKEIKGKWEWEKIPNIEIPRALWIDTVEGEELSFKGTVGTGELVFALEYLDTSSPFIEMGSVFVLYYDTITEKLRKFINKQFEGYSLRIFLDHVDTPQLM